MRMKGVYMIYRLKQTADFTDGLQGCRGMVCHGGVTIYTYTYIYIWYPHEKTHIL